jgi:hypothetical protein
MEIAFHFPNVALKIKGIIVFRFEIRCSHVIERSENSSSIEAHSSGIITDQVSVTAQPDAETQEAVCHIAVSVGARLHSYLHVAPVLVTAVPTATVDL